MADLPDDDLEDGRAALDPTLAATADILPWLARPRPPRFDPALNARWVAAGQALQAAWANRHAAGYGPLRPAIFSLYGVALDTADADCLHLGEALAGAADRLEDGAPPARLVAALSACTECLVDPAGLEHELFGERARHFARRLDSVPASAQDSARSAAIDQLFLEDAGEQLALLRDALAALPPDACALTSEAHRLATQADLAEVPEIVRLARQLADYAGHHAAELDATGHQQALETLIDRLAEAIAAVDG